MEPEIDFIKYYTTDFILSNCNVYILSRTLTGAEIWRNSVYFTD